MTTKILLLITIAISLTSAFAKIAKIPLAETIVKNQNEKNKSKYVLKNAKGTIVKSFFDINTPENWFNLSPATGAEGVSSELAYLSHGNPSSSDIIVAVIDSGVDVNHPDLQGNIWINQSEIPNNSLDDDKNGYTDDVFGWNFIGGAHGMGTVEKSDELANGLKLIKGNPIAQVESDTLEITRELVRMKKLKAERESAGLQLSKEESSYLKEVSEVVASKINSAKSLLSRYKNFRKIFVKASDVLMTAGLTEVTLEAVRAFTSSDPDVLEAKATILEFLGDDLDLAGINEAIAYFNDQLKYNYNEEFDPRTIVGDNYADQDERHYGNNDVIGNDASHGTHVSGIIAAVRDNFIGIKGVATNVKVMAIRVVPNGDERDKDVANGIRYAVDNGAKIINMSFGKAFSPYKSVVDAAVRYAQSKGVLLVHAAGNDSENNDVSANFPNRKDLLSKTEFTNWLEIGASSFQKGLTLPAEFSNYGKNSVDLFAPGVDIKSTTPDNNYDSYSGTSMASPAAAGVAALILSFDETMQAEGLRSLMMSSARSYDALEVLLPGSESEKVLFSTLSITGSIVDCSAAIDAIL